MWCIETQEQVASIYRIPYPPTRKGTARQVDTAGKLPQGQNQPPGKDLRTRQEGHPTGRARPEARQGHPPGAGGPPAPPEPHPRAERDTHPEAQAQTGEPGMKGKADPAPPRREGAESPPRAPICGENQSFFEPLQYLSLLTVRSRISPMYTSTRAP